MSTKFDARQTISRDTLNQMAAAADKELDDLLRSIDSELTSPLYMREQNPLTRVVDIGSLSIANPETGRFRSIAPISSVLPTFTSGTITMDATGAGNATPSVGSLVALGMSANEFLKLGVSLDSSGNLVLQGGTPGASLAAATTPPITPSLYAIGYIVVRTDGSNNVENVTASDIYQYIGASGAAGDVTGPASSTDNAIVRYDATTGKLVQNSGVIINDTDDITGVNSLNTITSTEINYLDNVTSNIQVQLDGKVNGPASATDNAITRFDATTGKLVQNSGVTIDDSNNISGAVAVNADDFVASLGAEATPSHTFTGDLDTGMWSPTANTLAFSTGASERMRINSSGAVGIGVSPTQALHVQGSGATRALVQSTGNFAGFQANSAAGFDSFILFNEAATDRFIAGFDFSSSEFRIVHGGNFANDGLQIDSSGNVNVSANLTASNLDSAEFTPTWTSTGTTATPTAQNARYIKYGDVAMVTAVCTFQKNASTVDLTFTLPAAIQPSVNWASNLEANGSTSTVDDLEFITGQCFSESGTKRIRCIMKYTGTTSTNQSVAFVIMIPTS